MMTRNQRATCLWCNGSILDDPETLTFDELPLEGGMGDLHIHLDTTQGRTFLHFMTPEREESHSIIPSREFTLGAIVSYLNSALLSQRSCEGRTGAHALESLFYLTNEHPS